MKLRCRPWQYSISYIHRSRPTFKAVNMSVGNILLGMALCNKWLSQPTLAKAIFAILEGQAKSSFMADAILHACIVMRLRCIQAYTCTHFRLHINIFPSDSNVSKELLCQNQINLVHKTAPTFFLTIACNFFCHVVVIKFVTYI